IETGGAASGVWLRPMTAGLMSIPTGIPDNPAVLREVCGSMPFLLFVVPANHDSGIKYADPDSRIDFPTPTRLADGLGLESSPVAYSGFTPELVPPVPPRQDSACSS